MARRSARTIVPIVAIAFCVGTPVPGSAGSFAWDAGCTQIRSNPPLYRAVIGFYSHLNFPVFCGVSVDSTSSGGSIPAAVLEATGPAWLSTALDPGTGSVSYHVDPCRSDWFVDSLVVVVDVPRPCFEVSWLTASPTWRHGETVCFTASAVTPTLRETWGRLKTLYR